MRDARSCAHCDQQIQPSNHTDAELLPRWVHVRPNLSTYLHCELTCAEPDPRHAGGLRERIERAQALMR